MSCLRDVDFVVSFEIEDDATVIEALRGVRPHFFTKGGDRTDFTNIPEWDVCQELGVQIVPKTGLNTSAFHNIHHSHAVVHFGEAMTIWDRICKTRLADRQT